MKVLIHIVVALHFLGLAAILGGWIAQRTGGAGWPWLVWGARAQVVTGLLLVGLHEMDDGDLNHVKIGTKLLVALAVAACAEIAHSRAKRGESAATLTDAAAGLTVLNVLVATLWT